MLVAALAVVQQRAVSVVPVGDRPCVRDPPSFTVAVAAVVLVLVAVLGMVALAAGQAVACPLRLEIAHRSTPVVVVGVVVTTVRPTACLVLVDLV